MSAIKRVLPFLLFWLTSLFGLAQSTTDFIVNKGEIAIGVIPIEAQYRFPQFASGKVYLRNNTFTRATLNYNLLYGEMQFIDHRGDTLSLVESHKLKLITVGDYVFFHAYKIGYLEVVSSYPQVKLARKQSLELIRSTIDLTSRSIQPDPLRVIGMDSQVTPGLVVKGKDWKLRDLFTQTAPGDLYFEKKATYFIVDTNEHFYEANKTTVMKLFPKHEKAIDEYIKEYTPDFSLRNDLQGLLAFCSQLDTK